MRTVHELSVLSGVSARTLHYYDAIGLLRPTRVSDAGYRYYDDAALARLQSILFLRELEFPLREIGRILDAPGFDAQKALDDQIRLLELRRERLDAIIASARKLQQSGGTIMSLSAFDTKKIDAYTEEAKKRWGETDAYQAFAANAAQKSEAEQTAAAEGLMAVFARFGAVRTLAPEGAEAQALVRELQSYLTANYYPCTDAILSSLGQMYTGDERFRAGIDARGGAGTAAFVSAAIAAFFRR